MGVDGAGPWKVSLSHTSELHQSLTIGCEIGNRQCEGAGLNNFGDCYQSLGDDPTEFEHHQQTLTIARDIDDGYEEAVALVGLGRAQVAGDELGQAVAVFGGAIEITGDRADAGPAVLARVGLAEALLADG